MLKIYGSRLCPDCVKCVADLTAAGVEFEYLDFSEDLHSLKAFLALRDEVPLFAEIRAGDKIGIPCLVRDDGSVTLTWDEYL